MQVTDEYVETLRLFLTADDAFEEASKRLERRDGAQGGGLYGVLEFAALRIAAQRRFGPTPQNRDVIQFVAHMRTAQQLGSDDIDPLTAETILHAAVGDIAGIGGPDARTQAIALTALLALMVRDLGLSGPDLDALLYQARILADRMLASQLPR